MITGSRPRTDRGKNKKIVQLHVEYSVHCVFIVVAAYFFFYLINKKPTRNNLIFLYSILINCLQNCYCAVFHCRLFVKIMNWEFLYFFYIFLMNGNFNSVESRSVQAHKRTIVTGH